MNIPKNEPSPSVQALIATRYLVQPGFMPPGEYNSLEQDVKQITRELSSQMAREEPDFSTMLGKSQELSFLLARLRDVNAALRQQTPNQKLPRPYVRPKVDHYDEIERNLLKAIESLRYAGSESMLGSLLNHTSDALYLVRDAFEEVLRVKQGR